MTSTPSWYTLLLPVSTTAFIVARVDSFIGTYSAITKACAVRLSLNANAEEHGSFLISALDD
jgi:hypothetical protein